MDFLTILLVAIVFFLIGAAIVGFIWYLVGISRRMHKGAKPDVPSQPNLDEIARLMRHTETQELVVEMDGDYFNTADELSIAQQHRLGFTSNVLTKWLMLPSPTSVPAAEPILPAFEPVPVESPSIEPPVEELHPDFIPPFAGEPLEGIKPVSTALSDVVGGILNPPLSPAPTFKSIANQINDVLQAHLVGTPLESRGITVQDGPDRGVKFTLDGSEYASVMDVPDEEVRDIIRDAVVEWDTKK
jgi:hypothetical protein